MDWWFPVVLIVAVAFGIFMDYEPEEKNDDQH